MSANNSQQQDNFDAMLKTALRAHTVPVRSDFTDKILKQVQALDEQKVLAKIVWQERLALAACIVLPAAALALIFMNPQILTDSWNGLKSLPYNIAKQIALMQYSWQFCVGLVAMTGVAIYSIFDMVFANR